MSMLPHVIADDGTLTVRIDGIPTPVGKSHAAYDRILDATRSGDLETLRKLLQPKRRIALRSNGRVTYKDGELYYDGRAIHTSIVSKVVAMENAGDDDGVESMLAFTDNLYKNPSMRAVNEAYGFVEACKLVITRDGHILAYKMIREDYTDIYTGKMDNSVGARPKMPRNMVDENKDQTCSDGLHFASREYVEKGNYGSRGRGHRMMMVKLNPEHIVSIPSDYNNSKGRACEYLILEEIPWGRRVELDTFGSQDDDDDNRGYDWDSDEDNRNSGQDDDDADGQDGSQDDDDDATATVARPASTKLSETDVRRFRRLLDEKLTLTAACKIIGISRRQGGRIRDKDNWKDVS